MRVCICDNVRLAVHPWCTDEENIRMGRAAGEEFRGLLNLAHRNISAIEALGSILFQMAGEPSILIFSAVEDLPSETHLSPSEDPVAYFWIWRH